MHRWIEWAEKASIIRRRYALNKEIILRALHHLRPRWYRSYRSAQVIVLLNVLYQLNNAELLLYKRFIQGSQVFLPDKTAFQFEQLYEALSKVEQLGIKLYRDARDQQQVLQGLSSDFANAEQADQVLQSTAITGMLRYSTLLAESDVISRKLNVASENISAVHLHVLGYNESVIIAGIDVLLKEIDYQLVALGNNVVRVMEYQKIAAVTSCCLFFAKFIVNDSSQHVVDEIEAQVKRIKSNVRV